MKRGILLIGMPGCGKSTLGRLLAEMLGYKFIDMDDHIEKNVGMEVKKIFSSRGEAFFREKESEACAEISNITQVVVASGGGTVKNSNNMNCFSDFLIIFINRPLELIMKDVNTESRPLLKAGKENLITLYRERIDLYRMYKELEIINDGPIEEVLKELIKKIKE